MRKLIMIALLMVFTVGTSVALTVNLAPTRCGESERVFGTPPCPQDPAFLAGTVCSEMSLKVGGNAYGCDSEWGTSLEFDLTPVPEGQVINSATLVVRKTGYADDAQGFAYLGAFRYPATGAEVAVPRDDLTPETAEDILYPPAANTDLYFDVTSAVQEMISDEGKLVGFILAGVYSEAGYHDYIFVGGTTNSNPPCLEVEYHAPVAAQQASWSRVKALFR